nr:ubiquinol-cytochrome c reductase iron-sulfur subunit [Polycladospora coralii]
MTYTLGGTAGFFASTMLFPMVRFAIDPVLKEGGGVGFVEAGLSEKDVTDTPQLIHYDVEAVDGWYEFIEKRTAYVFKNDKGKIVALSPTCKHLGCTVNYNGNPKFKNEFFCPCHFGRYFKDGTNVPGTPPLKPLDEYETKIENGRLLIGPVVKA